MPAIEPEPHYSSCPACGITPFLKTTTHWATAEQNCSACGNASTEPDPKITGYNPAISAQKLFNVEEDIYNTGIEDDNVFPYRMD